MKILIIGKFYSEGFAQHIRETLIEMGHFVSMFEPSLHFEQSSGVWSYRLRQIRSAVYELYARLPLAEQHITEQLKRSVAQYEPDLLLSCHDFLTADQVKAIKCLTHVPVALWYPDHIGLFRRGMFLNAAYDFLFFKDPYIVELLRNELGDMRAYYLPEACNPRYHKPVALTAEDERVYGCEVATAGNMHSNRAALFAQLTDFDCKIWGNPAPHWLDVSALKYMIQNRFVANEEKSKAFSAAKIVVNNLQPGEIGGTNVRTFEIAAAGGFQLVNDRPALYDLFEIGQEIQTFRSVAELKEKIRYYLDYPEERLAIAAAASKRALRDHTYERRLSELLQIIFPK